jgi:hypothetical protein
MFGAALNAQENHVLMLPGLHGSVPVLEKKTISIQRDLCYRLRKEYRVDGPRTKPKNRNLPSRLVVLVIFGGGSRRPGGERALGVLPAIDKKDSNYVNENKRRRGF